MQTLFKVYLIGMEPFLILIQPFKNSLNLTEIFAFSTKINLFRSWHITGTEKGNTRFCDSLHFFLFRSAIGRRLLVCVHTCSVRSHLKTAIRTWQMMEKKWTSHSKILPWVFHKIRKPIPRAIFIQPFTTHSSYHKEICCYLQWIKKTNNMYYDQWIQQIFVCSFSNKILIIMWLAMF